MHTNFEGVGVALITPFHADGTIDYPALGRLIDFVSEGGSDYLVVQGTTGETSTTSAEEKKALLAFTIQHNRRQLPVVYGLGGNSTQAVLQNIKDTDLTGVAAILSVCPYYNKPSQAGIIAHFRAIADASPVPVLLYNVPGRTVTNMAVSTILTLAEHPNIIGIKDAGGSFEQYMEIAKRMPEGFIFLSGDDNLVTPMISIGCVGVISVIANAFPVEFGRMTHLALAGNFKEAAQIQYQFLDFDSLLYVESNPVGIKECLAIKGVCESHVRLPLVKASAALSAQLKQEMIEEGLL
jgi:4-hydroxy-tetrahydrodipicolinate synthase